MRFKTGQFISETFRAAERLCVFFYSALSVAPLNATHKALYGRDLLNDTNGSTYGTLLRSLPVITAAMGIGL